MRLIQKEIEPASGAAAIGLLETILSIPEPPKGTPLRDSILAIERLFEDYEVSSKPTKRVTPNPLAGTKRPADVPVEEIDPEVPGSTGASGSVPSATAEVHPEQLDESTAELPAEAWEVLMEDHSGLQSRDHPATWSDERWHEESQKGKAKELKNLDFYQVWEEVPKFKDGQWVVRSRFVAREFKWKDPYRLQDHVPRSGNQSVQGSTPLVLPPSEESCHDFYAVGPGNAPWELMSELKKYWTISLEGPFRVGDSFVHLKRKRVILPEGVWIAPSDTHLKKLLELTGLNMESTGRDTPQTKDLSSMVDSPELSQEDVTLYRRITGILMYLATDRPDVQFT
eukprot:s1207_g6.t1